MNLKEEIENLVDEYSQPDEFSKRSLRVKLELLVAIAERNQMLEAYRLIKDYKKKEELK